MKKCLTFTKLIKPTPLEPLSLSFSQSRQPVLFSSLYGLQVAPPPSALLFPRAPVDLHTVTRTLTAQQPPITYQIKPRCFVDLHSCSCHTYCTSLNSVVSRFEMRIWMPGVWTKVQNETGRQRNPVKSILFDWSKGGRPSERQEVGHLLSTLFLG